MLHRMPLLLCAGLLCLGSARAQHAPIENGLPCVAEVCIDDDLTALLDLPWLAVPHGPGNPAAIPALSEILRADDEAMKAIEPYWGLHLFDAPGLAALARVKAVCRDIGVWQRPYAEYIARDGSRTRVVFEAEPSLNGSTAVFRVAMIVRRVPEGASAEHVHALAQEAQLHYDGLSSYASTAAPGAGWQSTSADGPALVLVAAVGDPQQRAADLSRHPLCVSD